MPLSKNWEENKTDSNFKGLFKSQKNTVIILAASAVFIIVFGVWQVSARINRPFNYQTATVTDLSNADYINLLKNTDTDKDGLSDYDEIYVYKTSPYLEDTDSDGLSDKQEVDNGTDPNCPQGKDCSAAIDTSTAATINASGTPADAGSSIGLNSTSANEAALQSALNGQSDAAALRQLLIESGKTVEELSQISDADLMRSYQEILQSQTPSQ
ncbi:MAG: thrombospondin type 3 repeat-containing protein [Candidatus Falkowbacteria bacterium]|nr:thrombospondin type 3 repeat-containing protein [Candidatus Falkowbacteria bacterium]